MVNEVPSETDASEPLIGRVFASRYRIEGKLGSGAMGTVYRARHVKIGRPFAVKMLHERLLVEEKLRKRFAREAELAGKLHHVNVVGVVDVGETEDGIHFMVMEYADGVPLGALIDGPMETGRVIEIVKQLLDGLQHAHEHGLIHRDFKPDNVIVETDKLGVERPRIVDFGIAILRDDGTAPDRADRLTTDGLVLGTPHYMAPEHAMGVSIDHRIDLFALGVVLYELLTGKLPFDGDGVDVARANLLMATPPMSVRAPGVVVDPLLEAFTRLLMQKVPDDRPQSAKEARWLVGLIATDRPAAAAALGVERLADEVPSARAVPAIATPTEGSARHDAPVASDKGRRAPPAPVGYGRAQTQPGPDRMDSTTTSAVGARGGRRADSQPPADSQPGERAESRPRVPRAATQPGANRRAATVLPAPRRMFAIAFGAGLVIVVALIVAFMMRRDDSPSATPNDSTEVAAGPSEANDAEVAAADAGTVTVAADAAASDPIDASVPEGATPAIRNIPPRPQSPRPPKPKQPTQPAPPIVADTSASAVAQLYGSVGRELKALDVRRGSGATSPLWPRYLRIKINDAITTEEKRAEAHRLLTALRTDIAAAR